MGSDVGLAFLAMWIGIFLLGFLLAVLLLQLIYKLTKKKWINSNPKRIGYALLFSLIITYSWLIWLIYFSL